MLPTLMVPMLKRAGSRLAVAMSSLMLLSGLSLPTTMMKSNSPMVDTVAKSLDQSYGIDRNNEGLAAFWPLTRSKVWPSGEARATAAAAVMPPAPGMFSITTGLPNESPFSARRRAR